MDARISEAIEALNDAADLAESAGRESQAEEFARASTGLRSLADVAPGQVYVLTGPDLSSLVSALKAREDGFIYQVSVAIDGGLKIKVNELSWTPPLGALRSS